MDFLVYFCFHNKTKDTRSDICGDKIFLVGLSGGMLGSWFNDKPSITIHLPYQNLKHKVKIIITSIIKWLHTGSFLQDSGTNPQVQQSSHSYAVEIAINL